MNSVRKVKRFQILPGILMPLVAAALLMCFLSGISNVTQGHLEEDKQRLEEVLREAAVSCYSVEGSYPPTLEYLEQHYGVQIDRRHFIVRYTAIAENLMPDITVLEK